jgi:ubiquinone/menaquinone biosynthesis C-methylase UbiE
MGDRTQWKRYWDDQGRRAASDYEFDRGTSRRTTEIENLSTEELRDFIKPNLADLVFDAGCGTGTNILLLHSIVRLLIGLDYSASALARCRRRIAEHEITNVEVMQGDVTALPLPNDSADKVLCMSVLQYLNDQEARTAFAEFARILKDRGLVILHVKNLSSLYLSTLWAAKRLLSLFGNELKLEYFRPYGWYVKELAAAGFEILHYNSFNVLMIEPMPRRLLSFLQKLELQHRKKFPFCTSFVRRHGSELKIKARVRKLA